MHMTALHIRRSVSAAIESEHLMSRAHLVLRERHYGNITLSFHKGSTPFWPYLHNALLYEALIQADRITSATV